MQFCSGVRTQRGANCRPERKRSGSLTEAANAVAETMPTPGIVARRCDRSLSRYQGQQLLLQSGELDLQGTDLIGHTVHLALG